MQQAHRNFALCFLALLVQTNSSSWEAQVYTFTTKKATGPRDPRWQEVGYFHGLSLHGLEGGPFTLSCPPRDCGRTPALHSQCRCLNLDKPNVLHWDVSMVQQPISETRELSILPAALAADCPWPHCLPLITHFQLSNLTISSCLPWASGAQPGLHQSHMSNAASLVNSHTSSKQQTIDMHLNHPQIPIFREWCNINKAVPAAVRIFLTSNGIKTSTRFSLKAVSNQFSWRTQAVSRDLWRRGFCTPCVFKV